MPNNVLLLLLGLGLFVVVALATRRLAKGLLTLRAKTLQAILLRPLSRWVKAFHYDDDQFFQADGAGEAWVVRRRAGIERLSEALRQQYPAS